MGQEEILHQEDADSRLLKTLGSLNQISSTINQIGADTVISSIHSLQMIVESAILVIPGSSAVIYTFDETAGEFESDSRVSADPAGISIIPQASVNDDHPRPDGIGVRSISRRKRTISYEESDIEVHPFHAKQGVRAVCCFPLIVVKQVVGVLYIYLREKRSFSPLELLMLENFVNQAAMAIYHTRRLANMQRDLARKEDEINRLHRASMLISSRLRLEETLKSILQLAMEMTNAHYGIFRLLDRSGQNLVTRAFVGNDMQRPQLENLPIETNSVMGLVAQNRIPLLISDLQDPQWANIYYPLDAGFRMRSELAVPLINASGGLEGVLNIESPEPRAFDENSSHMLQSLATYAVTAIQEVRLLDALQEIARQIFALSYKDVITHLVNIACELLNASGSAIWVIQDTNLVLEASSGGYRHDEKIPIIGSLTGMAILNREAVFTNNVQTDPRFLRQDLAEAQNWEHALIVPLITNENDHPLGAFSVYSTTNDSGRFSESEWDKKVLTFLSHYAVLALQFEQKQQDLQLAQEQRSVAETFAAVGDIASNLLHHLNNKVGTIPVRVQSIQDKYALALEKDPYLSNNLQEIERCAMEAMQTVRINLSHLRPIHLEPVYVAARVMDAIKTSELPKNVKVQVESLEYLPVVLAGGQSLTFVFSNLLMNASDAMKGEGIIQIKGYAQPKWVEITVSDSGPGIPPEIHSRIFELNFSGRSGNRIGKLGFGLWWVKTLMTRLGGSITIESDGRSGTTFRLRLPRLEVSA